MWGGKTGQRLVAGFGADRTGALGEHILGWHYAMRCDAKLNEARIQQIEPQLNLSFCCQPTNDPPRYGE